MRRRGLVFGFVLSLLTASASAVEAQQELPYLGMPELQPASGQFLYIDFWASWCGPCRQSFPWMSEMQAKFGSRGLKVVAVNLDAKRSDADKFLSPTPAQFKVVFDERAESAKRLAIKAMPTSLLVSPEGRVLWVHSGFRKEDGPELEARIASALGNGK
jgi:cytochrome c biogenesis protein CcmG/thiol:disulfide interchange protein DsbE